VPPDAGWLRERLAPRAAGVGSVLTTAASEALARYLALLVPWNARVNLTAARDAETLVEAHLGDGVAILGQLPGGPHRLVDAGAGAGFVGVTVALLRPDAHCVLLEPSTKRYAFLRAVARELPVANLEPLLERLDEHAARPDLTPYEVAVSRATWPPLEWLVRAEPLLRPGGVAVAFEGARRLRLPPGVERLERPDGRGALLLRRLPE
jgi:16S rRNA (guanine527-N7)-methyltransferase